MIPLLCYLFVSSFFFFKEFSFLVVNDYFSTGTLSKNCCCFTRNGNTFFNKARRDGWCESEVNNWQCISISASVWWMFLLMWPRLHSFWARVSFLCRLVFSLLRIRSVKMSSRFWSGWSCLLWVYSAFDSKLYQGWTDWRAS